MCHIILLFPIFGLFLFWIIPFTYAFPLYLLILTVSVFIYFKIMQAMNRQSKSGPEAMIGHTVKVIRTKGHRSRVLYDGETWDAESDKLFIKGEHAEIFSVKGLTLYIGKPFENKNVSSMNHY